MLLLTAAAPSFTAVVIAALEVAAHLRQQPANDTDSPHISGRLRTRMHLAATLLGAALVLLLIAQFTSAV